MTAFAFRPRPIPAGAMSYPPEGEKGNMTIFNRGKPRHAKPRRRLAAMLAAVLTAMALVFAQGVAFADSGMDVSKWQGCVGSGQAATAKASGVNFGFVKVTEGNGYTDSVADCTMQSLKANGIRRGVYHFARPDLGNSPEAEADWFVSQTRGYMHDGVIPVLDWEPSGSYKTWSWWALRWLQRVEAAWGVKPMIYTSASVIQMTDWTSVANGNYGLWVAGYPRGYAGETLRDPGAVPYSVSPWPFAAAWQYSSTGNVPGIGSRIDVNWFYGDAGTWARYAGSKAGSAANPATPSPTPQQGAPVGDAQSLATAVIRGDYGNDPTRRQLLGNRYAEVMAIVNQRLRGNGGTGNGTGYWVVQRGEYLSLIGARTGVPWTTIAALNGIRSPYVIHPGQKLSLGGANGNSAANTGRRSVVITAGDCLWNHFGADSARVAAANGISNPNLVRAGTVIHY